MAGQNEAELGPVCTTTSQPLFVQLYVVSDALSLTLFIFGDVRHSGGGWISQ